jgi:beta-glucosidase
MEMVSRFFNEYGPQLVKEGKVPMRAIDEAVRRVLRIKYRLGLFEHPYSDAARESATLRKPEYLAAAREAASHTFVLLKNEKDTLPIRNDIKSIAVIGPLADDQQSVMGSWPGDGKKEDAVSLLAGIRANAPSGTTINYAKGCEVSSDSLTGLDEAAHAAEQSDFVILAVGESSDMSGEASARSSLDLPGRQLELIQAIHKTGKPYAVVLMNGRPLSINWVAENSPAILETWFGGSQAGNAIADVLFGKVNPGGKLPVTFPRSVGQVPLYYNHKSTGRPAVAADKYSSKYIDGLWTPLYPFGYGLSYTHFKLSNLHADTTRPHADGKTVLTVAVENAGSRAGDEVVQLYIRHPAASITRPVKELKGFRRVSLKAWEKSTVQFTLGPAELGFYNRSMQFAVEPGTVEAFIGSSSQDTPATAKLEIVR